MAELTGIAYALAMGEKLEESFKLDSEMAWKDRVEKAREEVQAEQAKKKSKKA